MQVFSCPGIGRSPEFRLLNDIWVFSHLSRRACCWLEETTDGGVQWRRWTREDRVGRWKPGFDEVACQQLCYTKSACMNLVGRQRLLLTIWLSKMSVFNALGRRQRLSLRVCFVNGGCHPGSVSSTEVAVHAVHHQRWMLMMLCNDRGAATMRARCGTSDVAWSGTDRTDHSEEVTFRAQTTRYGRCQCLDLPTWWTTLS